MDKKRFLHTYWLSIAIASVIMAIGMVLMLTVPTFFLGLFSVTDPTELAMGATAFREICVCFLPAAFGIITITLLQATQNGLMAMAVAFCRQFIFLIPAALVVKAIAGSAYLDYIWWCYPVAEVLAVCLSLPLSRFFGIKAFTKRKKLLDSLQASTDQN